MFLIILMTIMDYTKKVDYDTVDTVELQNLTTNVKESCTKYITLLSKYNAVGCAYVTDYDVLISTSTTREYLKNCTKAYRQYVHKVSPEYKRHSMVVQSYQDKELLDYLGYKFNYKFNSKSTHDRVKLTYTRDKYIHACVVALAFLFAKYPTAYDFQVYATLVSVLMDYFDLRKVDPNVLKSFDTILSLDIECVKTTMTEIFGTVERPKIHKKRINPKNTINLPTKEQFLRYEASGKYANRKELIDAIAKKYKCSVRAVKYRLKEYGLTRGYNSKDTDDNNQGQTPIVLAPAEKPTEVKACGGFNIMDYAPTIEVKHNDIDIVDRVMDLIRSGLSNSAIARKLKISINRLYVLYEDNPKLLKAKKNYKTTK